MESKNNLLTYEIANKLISTLQSKFLNQSQELSQKRKLNKKGQSLTITTKRKVKKKLKKTSITMPLKIWIDLCLMEKQWLFNVSREVKGITPAKN